MEIFQPQYLANRTLCASNNVTGTRTRVKLFCLLVFFEPKTKLMREDSPLDPAFPPAGIWRPVSIAAHDYGQIIDVAPIITSTDDHWVVSVQIFRLTVTLLSMAGNTSSSDVKLRRVGQAEIVEDPVEDAKTRVLHVKFV